MPKVTTTNRKDFKPLGRRADYSWEVLRQRLRELGPDFGALLAEPIADLGAVDWHADFSGSPRQISELDAAEADALLTELKAMRAQVHSLADRIEAPGPHGGDKGLADALRRATVTPDDTRFVWSMDGKPVLVAWGMVNIDDERPESAIIGEGLLRPVAVPGGTSAAPASDVVPSPPPLPTSPRHRSPAWLWLLFAGLVGVIYFLLLQACGVLVAPEHGLFGRIFPAACHSPATAKSAIAERAELQRKIKKAELDLARLQGDCAPPAQPKRQAQVQPPAQPGRPDNSDVEKRLERERAKTGRLQISLAWNGTEDLDLHVRCPGGILYHGDKKACGGTLDVDMNSEVHKIEAVENAVWPNPPAGRYEVSVRWYPSKEAVPRLIPFTVRIRRDGDVQTFNGTVSESGQTVVVHAFTL